MLLWISKLKTGMIANENLNVELSINCVSYSLFFSLSCLFFSSLYLCSFLSEYCVSQWVGQAIDMVEVKKMIMKCLTRCHPEVTLSLTLLQIILFVFIVDVLLFFWLLFLFFDSLLLIFLIFVFYYFCFHSFFYPF